MEGNRELGDRSLYLQKFRLYETRSNFYMIGRDKSRTVFRVLKIDRVEPSEFNIFEDSTNYTESDCFDLLKRIHEGNRLNGGLKFVTKCYGIAGFVKFLGPYYMLLITERRKIGVICGHTVYAVSKSKMIALPNPTIRPNTTYSKDENRYKKLLCTVDLTKDFFFSYSYHIMCSLQKNLCNGDTGQVYETMFVWNEYLTRGIRSHLQNTMWTVALVYGFFKQAKLTVSEKEFCLTLIARRSRHFAGTRYLKRGVNEKGRVANDVETEQIVFEDNAGGIPTQISSVVQHRGSIPLFWSQESSWRNMKPDIILHKDQNYEATRLHFENLVKRYGNPIIVLNLIKTREKKPRETILRAEFAKAIDYINKSLPEDSRIRFLHWDLHKYSRRKATKVLTLLGKVAAYALDLTGFFYVQMPPASRLQDALTRPLLVKDADQQSPNNHHTSTHNSVGSQEDSINNSDFSLSRHAEDEIENDGHILNKPLRVQNGVLRTNCIDCLDRTNVAQYAYGLTALGHQLHALGFIDDQNIDLDTPLADELMCFYERMGDTLAFQYGGSAAHNKIFSERRGQWKAATHSQEFLRTLQRYYSNAYMDAEKQDAINVFLGYYQPRQGKPALWELDSDQHYNIGRRGHTTTEENSRSFIKRSMSDGNILCEDSSPISRYNIGEATISNSMLRATVHHKGDAQGYSDSTPEILTCENEISYSRCNPVMSRRHLLTDSDEVNYFNELKLGVSNVSNFLDFDWISSSGNSCEEENYERSSLINSPVETLSSENVPCYTPPETTRDPSENSIEGRETTGSELFYSAERTSDLRRFSRSFIDWVLHGEALC
ncbi:phosphoinositide phosphatase SAC2-like [Asparagus officinalis]|uniref:phosphoinositide phosphatase SAC2-like n=1 Tax=Asparagus officinalis TaxID=4686 RepID=UPI00098E8288|nr:phosphoinositide phosphatase SAC2-like [Asparagus officinalis]